MDNGEEKLKIVREKIDADVLKILAWAAMFEGMDQETAAVVEIPSHALGEAGRSIRQAVLSIQEHLDDLDAE
ncbi:hypothetical protein H5P28_04530 [Ruficoccus amylovorans]|uniref:Uncharacterized protein n=1 Tax=Ruficoccus amylovorans TaxID=1804625 RepID=A0A842HAS6_9BACT|nr:hypothetical protein [Ruficoccus amylovorans]MBC2593522.1 hypothetical protein [Ruficoccus amylovorans]